MTKNTLHPDVGVPRCFKCKHYQGDFYCDAYPNRIPSEILGSMVDHRKPYKGDHDIQFEEKTL